MECADSLSGPWGEEEKRTDPRLLSAEVLAELDQDNLFPDSDIAKLLDHIAALEERLRAADVLEYEAVGLAKLCAVHNFQPTQREVVREAAEDYRARRNNVHS